MSETHSKYQLVLQEAGHSSSAYLGARGMSSPDRKGEAMIRVEGAPQASPGLAFLPRQRAAGRRLCKHGDGAEREEQHPGGICLRGPQPPGQVAPGNAPPGKTHLLGEGQGALQVVHVPSFTCLFNLPRKAQMNQRCLFLEL